MAALILAEELILMIIVITLYYTLLNCCFWMVVIFFVSVTTGIAVNAFNVGYDDFAFSMSIAITMGCIIGLFLCCNLLTYWYIQKEAGQIYCF